MEEGKGEFLKREKNFKVLKTDFAEPDLEPRPYSMLPDQAVVPKPGVRLQDNLANSNSKIPHYTVLALNACSFQNQDYQDSKMPREGEWHFPVYGVLGVGVVECSQAQTG